MLLKLINVSKIYKMDGSQVHALDNVSLEIKREEFISIIGPSGSGKSTLMHILGCLDKPSRGRVFFEDQEISKMDEVQLASIRNRKIGFVFQSFNLLPRTSVLDNVLLPCVYSSEKKPVLSKAKKILQLVDLEERIDHLPNQLSGGEQQRVAIARALINDPAILLADEPTGNLDSKKGKELMKLFKELNQQGQTIILVTHDTEIAGQAKRIIKIKDGKLA